MAMGLNTRTVVTSAILVVLVVAGLYILDPTLAGLLAKREGFDGTLSVASNYAEEPGQNDVPGGTRKKATTDVPTNASGPSDAVANVTQGFADLGTAEGPAGFGDAQAPAGCYPRDQLTPSELLPKDPNSVWAQQNPMGTGSSRARTSSVQVRSSASTRLASPSVMPTTSSAASPRIRRFRSLFSIRRRLTLM